MRNAHPFEKLRSFAEFWLHDAKNATCCKFASQEDIDADPEAYDCSSCEVSRELKAFEADLENAQAWQLFHKAVTRFTKDLGIAGVILERMTRDVDGETLADLLDRFEILYQVFAPPPERNEQET